MYDKTWLYGILQSTNRTNGDKKVLYHHKSNQNGILAWSDFLQEYDNNGSEVLRAEELASLVLQTYHTGYPGGISTFIDHLQANHAELSVLRGVDAYNDRAKRDMLFASLRHAPNITHLIQTARDKEMSFQEATTYIRSNALYLETEVKKFNKVQQT